MPTYLDVRAVRIQQYLARSTSLAGYRGASLALSESTGVQDLIDGLGLELLVRPNTAAGDADGVVSFEMLDGADPKSVANTVINDLRRQLPAVQLEAVWGEGASYVEAYRTARHNADAGLVVRSVPAPADVPTASLCQSCGLDTAVDGTSDENQAAAVCADCKMRHDRGRRERSGLLPAEKQLLLALDMDAGSRCRDFDELAGLGSVVDNHVATVFIDGNAMGMLFSRITETGMDKDAVSRGLVAATAQALREGARAATNGLAKLAVIPHLVGGDDVLVSVTADRAWAFATAYLSSFERGMSDLLMRHGGGDLPTPTASGGITIAHQKHPFSQTVALSDRLLSAAKRQGGGAVSTIAWTDVTRDGPQVVEGRAPWRLVDLGSDRDLDSLALLAETNKSLFATLRSAADTSPDAVRNLCARHGIALSHLPHDGNSPALVSLRERISIAPWWSRGQGKN